MQWSAYAFNYCRCIDEGLRSSSISMLVSTQCMHYPHAYAHALIMSLILSHVPSLTYMYSPHSQCGLRVHPECHTPCFSGSLQVESPARWLCFSNTWFQSRASGSCRCPPRQSVRLVVPSSCEPSPGAPVSWETTTHLTVARDAFPGACSFTWKLC